MSNRHQSTIGLTQYTKCNLWLYVYKWIFQLYFLMEIGPDSRILDEWVPHYKAWKAQIEPFVVILAPSLALCIFILAAHQLNFKNKEGNFNQNIINMMPNGLQIRIFWSWDPGVRRNGQDQFNMQYPSEYLKPQLTLCISRIHQNFYFLSDA